jgi:hypothetical protein
MLLNSPALTSCLLPPLSMCSVPAHLVCCLQWGPLTPWTSPAWTSRWAQFGGITLITNIISSSCQLVYMGFPSGPATLGQVPPQEHVCYFSKGGHNRLLGMLCAGCPAGFTFWATLTFTCWAVSSQEPAEHMTAALAVLEGPAMCASGLMSLAPMHLSLRHCCMPQQWLQHSNTMTCFCLDSLIYLASPVVATSPCSPNPPHSGLL